MTAPRPLTKALGQVASSGGALSKSWSSDLQTRCAKEFGGDCHWITLHGGASDGDGAHVLLGPPQGKGGHRHIVWAPQGTGLEHLRLLHVGDGGDIKARAQEKARQKARAEAQRRSDLSPEERKAEDEGVTWARGHMDALRQEHDALLKGALGLSPDEALDPKTVGALYEQARKVAPHPNEDAPGEDASTEDSPTGDASAEEPSQEGESSGEGTPPEENPSSGDNDTGSKEPKSGGATGDAPEGAQGEEEGGESASSSSKDDKGQDDGSKKKKRPLDSSRAVQEAIYEHAAQVLTSELTGAPTPRGKRFDQLPPDAQAHLQKAITPEVAHQILAHRAKMQDFSGKAREAVMGALSREEAESSLQTPATPQEVESQVRRLDPKRVLADEARAGANAALWKSFDDAHQAGAIGVRDAFRQGGTESLAALVGNALESSVSPRLVATLGVEGTAALLANELTKRGDKGAVARLVSHIESEAAKLHSEDGDGVLSHINALQKEMERNDALVKSGDLSASTGKSLNLKLSLDAQKMLGTAAGRLEAGAKLARALQTQSKAKSASPFVLEGGKDAGAVQAQMDSLGLGHEDYELVPREDGTHALALRESGQAKLLGAANRDRVNDAIRDGQTRGDYSPPPGWNPDMHLKPEQVSAVQFSEHNGRVLIDASTGLGKTAIGAACALEEKAAAQKEGRSPRVLVLTTAGVRKQYAQELNRFAPGLSVSLAAGTSDENTKALHDKNADCVVCAHDALVHNADAILGQKWDRIIIDEADKLISPEGGGPSIRASAFEQLSRLSSRVVATTATPLRNSAREYFQMLHLLHPDRFSNYGDFAAKYASLGEGSGAFDASISKALSRETGDTVFSQRLGEGTLHSHHDVHVPILDQKSAGQGGEGAQEKAQHVRERHREVERQFESEQEDPDLKAGAASRRDMGHMLAAYDETFDNPTQQEAKRIADAHFDKGERGIVFADYLPILDTFRKGHKEGEWLEYSGNVSAQGFEREDLKDAFNNGTPVEGVRVAFEHGGTNGHEGVVESVHRTRVSNADKKQGKRGQVTGYTIRKDDGTRVTLDARANVKSLMRGLVATRAAQYGLNLQKSGRYVMRFGHPYTPTAYEQEVGRLRSREQSEAGRDTHDYTLTTDHPVAGVRRAAIFGRKEQLTRGREHYLLSDEHGV